MQIIPVTNDYVQTLRTVLGGQEVDLSVWYQDIGSGWFISLAFSDGTQIVNGYRINTCSRVLKAVSSNFAGDIICVSTIGKTEEPGPDAPWGNSHTLLHVTDADLVEIGLETL